MSKKPETEEQIRERIVKGAEITINSLIFAFTKDDVTDNIAMLLFASGLAGVACHEAVKTENLTFDVVETADKKKYYFGDSVDKFLLKGQNSILSYAYGLLENLTPKCNIPDINEIIKGSISHVGDSEYKIWGSVAPKQIYPDFVNCWNNLFNDITMKYCKNGEEWVMMYGIVLQNIMRINLNTYPAENVFGCAMECAVFVSKLDFDSI